VHPPCHKITKRKSTDIKQYRFFFVLAFVNSLVEGLAKRVIVDKLLVCIDPGHALGREQVKLLHVELIFELLQPLLPQRIQLFLKRYVCACVCACCVYVCV
jgi:hypothetical protein